MGVINPWASHSSLGIRDLRSPIPVSHHCVSGMRHGLCYGRQPVFLTIEQFFNGGLQITSKVRVKDWVDHGVGVKNPNWSCLYKWWQYDANRVQQTGQQVRCPTHEKYTQDWIHHQANFLLKSCSSENAKKFVVYIIILHLKIATWCNSFPAGSIFYYFSLAHSRQF